MKVEEFVGEARLEVVRVGLSENSVPVDEQRMALVIEKALTIIEAQRAALKEIANSDAINTVFSQYDINDVDGPAMSEARIIARAALEEEV